MGVGDWISQHIFGQSPTTAATSGAASANDPVAFDPATGMYFDSRNGQYYSDPQGQTPVAGPNSVQQIGGNLGIQRQLLGSLATDHAQQQAGFGGEQQLASMLNGAITGATPSVAQTQLGMGQDALAAEQLSQAAGVSGAAGPLAQLLAARNTAAGQLGMNQQAALLRAQETAQARQQLGQVYGNMAQQGQAAYGADLTGGLGAGQTAAGLASGHESNEEDRNKSNNQFLGNMITKLASGGSSGAAAAAPMM